MAQKGFSLRFKLFGSSIVILALVVVLIVGTLVVLQGIQKRANDLFNVYNSSTQILSDASSALYKFNSRGYQLIVGATDPRVFVDANASKFELGESLNVLARLETDFATAMPPEIQSETIREQMEILLPRLAAWLEQTNKLPPLTSLTNEFSEIFLQGEVVEAFKRSCRPNFWASLNWPTTTSLRRTR